MQLDRRNLINIRRSYGRRNRQFVGFFMHLFAFFLANSWLSMPTLASLWLLVLFGHFIWLLIYSGNERRYRRALGEKTVVIPVYDPHARERYVYEFEEERDNVGYIHAADGSVLEVIEDEEAVLPIQKRKHGND